MLMGESVEDEQESNDGIPTDSSDAEDDEPRSMFFSPNHNERLKKQRKFEGKVLQDAKASGIPDVLEMHNIPPRTVSTLLLPFAKARFKRCGEVDGKPMWMDEHAGQFILRWKESERVWVLAPKAAFEP